MEPGGIQHPGSFPFAGGGRWALRAAAAGIVLAGVLAYSNSLRGPFIFDDVDSISENPSIRSLWPIRPALCPPGGQGSTVEGRRLVNLSLAVCYAFGELNVVPYHAFNLAVHVLAALTFFGVVRRTLLLASLRERFGADSVPLALTAALLWMLHPLQTASVTYIVQRAESMMGLFYLLTFYCAIRGVGSSRPLGWHVGASLACALGTGCKEVIASAPLMVLLYDRVFVFPSFREVLRRRWALYAGLVLSWALLGIELACHGNRGGTVGMNSGQVTPVQYAMTQSSYILRYLALAFWPDKLILDYGYPDAGVPIVRSFWVALPWAAVVLAMLAATVLALRRAPKAGFLGVWFFVALAPSSSFLPILTEPVAEHRMYLPLAAVVLLVVVGGRQLAWSLANRPACRKAGACFRLAARAAPVALAATLGVLTFARNRDYRSDLTIWDDTVRKRPLNARAHNSLGISLAARGQHERAILEYMRALELKPNYADAYNSRGNSLAALGLNAPALSDLNKAIEFNPTFAKAYNNRGQVFVALRKYEAAIWDCTRALELKPGFAEACNTRGNALFEMGRLRQAIQDYSLAAELDPRSPVAFHNRGNAHLLLKQYDSAVWDFTRAIALQPDLAPAYKSRAWAWYNLRDYDQARADVARCRQLGGTVHPKLAEMIAQAVP